MPSELGIENESTETQPSFPIDADVQTWDYCIRPKSEVFSIDFNEIWRYRDLLLLFTYRDIVSFYKQTILGPIWFFIQPIFTTLIYIVVFGKIARLSTDGAPQLLFYMTGIVMWNYFSECFSKTATVFRDNANLFGKVYFPRVIAPISVVVSSLVRLAIQIVLVTIFAVYYFLKGDISPQPAVLLLPFIIANMAVMGLAFGMLVSALTTKYRDLVFLLQFGVQLLMYATPVIYPTSQIPPSVASVLAWNPLAPLFEAVRFGVLGTTTFSFWGLSYSACFTALSFLIATVVFNRVEKTFMDTV